MIDRNFIFAENKKR